MKRNRLSILKKYAAHAMVAMVVVGAGGYQTANADPITSVFDASWTQIAAEDSDGSISYVGPGYGGQDFDAEYLYYKLEGNILSIGLQAGFDLVNGDVLYGGKWYYAGDLALSFDGNASTGNATTYEYGFDFGLLTKDYQGDMVGDTDGINEAGLYAVTKWNTDVYSGYVISNPFAMETGDLISSANGTTSAGQDSDSYWRIVSFDITSIGDFVALDAHWTMSCGNDAIDGHATAPVPEPATMLLFGTGITGLAALQRRKSRRA